MKKIKGLIKNRASDWSKFPKEESKRKFNPNLYTSVSNHNSLYYYKGNNIAKQIGKYILKLDFLIYTSKKERKNIRQTVELNKALRAQSDYANYLKKQQIYKIKNKE